MKMIIMKTNESIVPSAGEVGRFLAQYASWLMGCGATCIRIEKNVDRIARSYDKRVEISIMPRHIQLSVFSADNDCECLTVNTSVKSIPINFSINARLSELSWKIADKKLPLTQAKRLFNKIIPGTPQDIRTTLLLVGCANASFCRLFGGDFVAMGVVGIATVAGYWLKTFLLSRHVDVRVVFMLCAFVSAVLGCTDILFSLGSTPTIALSTSVLYLIPGIPFINSFSDMLYRHYVCALSRFSDALVLTCCLSAGLCLGMLVMNVGMF